MSSSKPYIIRALYEWILDNNMVPHIAVDANNPNVCVPMQYAKDGKIILNVSPNATQRLLIDNQCISFGARFSGTAMEVYAPVRAILAIYARETGEGMVFDPALEQDDDEGDNVSTSSNDSPGTSGTPSRPSVKGTPTFTVVK